jgi:hypothetical protein
MNHPMEAPEIPKVQEAVIYSINKRAELQSSEAQLKKKFPKLQIVIGKLTPDDRPIPLSLLDMEKDRQNIFDAATETVLGKRVDLLEKPVKHPIQLYTYIIGLLSGVGLCYLFYNVFPTLFKSAGM